MNKFVMNNCCISAKEKCICTNRSEANQALHVIDGENAQLARLRTKDNVFIVWLYDGEEETLLYPAFKCDENHLPNLTDVIAADEVLPDTAFFYHKTGEYYYLQATKEECATIPYKYWDIIETEIRQIVFFANERMVWQIFNQFNYPELPRVSSIHPYLLKANGKPKAFWCVELSFYENCETQKLPKAEWLQQEAFKKQWMEAGINAQQFWNIAFSSKTETPKSAFLTIEDARGDKKLEEEIKFCNENGIISRNLEYLFSDVIRKAYSWFVLFPVLCQNSTLSSKNKEELKCQVTTIKSLQFKIDLSDTQEEKLELQEQLDAYKIVQGKTLLFDDGGYYSFDWNDKIGLNIHTSKKPRLFFLRNNQNTINATYISMPKLTRQEILEQSLEDSLFRSYLIRTDPRLQEQSFTEFKKDRSKEKNLSSE